MISLKPAMLLSLAKIVAVVGLLAIGGYIFRGFLTSADVTLANELQRLEDLHSAQITAPEHATNSVKALEPVEDASRLEEQPSANPPGYLDPIQAEQAPEIPFYFETPNSKSQQRLKPYQFPPVGHSLGKYKAQVFYPLQKRFSDVTIHLSLSDSVVYLYGATLCEEIQMAQVILTPCIFMDQVGSVNPDSFELSTFELDILRTLDAGRKLAFYPWSRFATSYLSCGSEGNYRMSLQFGNKEDEVWVSIKVPFSSDSSNALEGLELSSLQPCSGLDLFFQPTELSDMLFMVSEVKKQIIAEKY